MEISKLGQTQQSEYTVLSDLWQQIGDITPSPLNLLINLVYDQADSLV